MTKYLVVYSHALQLETGNAYAPYRYERITRTKSFDNEQEAIQFAIKNDGYIVQPASIQSRVVQK